jgi:GNAT superfamily N-acetyltransferase
MALHMLPRATSSSAAAVLPLRVRQRQEMNCQIVHDSLHRRPGWTHTYALWLDDRLAGFGSVAVGGPWTGKATIFEFFLLPEHRHRAFCVFEQFLHVSAATFFEVQSNDELLAVMLHAYAVDVVSESIAFRDGVTTALPSPGGTLQQLTSDEHTRAAISARHGGAEWRLDVDGEPAATGGILFHYNEPYGDVYIDVAERFRRRGYGAYVVQELKRVAYELGAVPCARCRRENVASRKTLQKAGFVPYAHILVGRVADR